MSNISRLCLLLILLLNSSIVHAKGGFFGCFGCNFWFTCNPRDCPPGTADPSSSSDRHASFNIDTAVVSNGGIPVLNIDRYLRASVYNDLNNGDLIVRIQATDDLPSHTDVTRIALQFGRADPVRVQSPDVHTSMATLRVPAQAVNRQILGTGQSVIECNLVYAVDGEL